MDRELENKDKLVLVCGMIILGGHSLKNMNNGPFKVAYNDHPLFKFNIVSHTWMKIEPIGQVQLLARSNFGSVITDDTIYLCGGLRDNWEAKDCFDLLTLGKQ